MPLAPGTKLGPYEICSPLGSGGMGEVYRAKDTRLGRDVAIKILPEHLSQTPEARQRFEREARAVSSLSHANICPLFDVGSQNGTEYLVMEFLEGETLAERLTRGPLKIDELQEIAIDIAEALETAHRQGIIHRDLKPGNVMLTKSGAKLMDFGLAKPSVAMAGASDLLTPSGPTVSIAALTSAASPVTQKGTIVGTFQYIAPEVLQGKEADARSDIFSFGCVLFEMATGKRAFEGKSQLSVFTAILESEPPLVSAVQPLSPRGLDDIVENCLAKDPDERYSSAHDVKLQLRSLDPRSASSSAIAGPATTPRIRYAQNLFFAVAALAVLVAGLLGYFTAAKRHHDVSLRVQITPPDKTSYLDTGDSAGAPVLSPQGDRLAFVVEGPNSSKALWVRNLDNFAAQRLEGTEDASHPFWSPDGRYIGFFSRGKLNKILATGGPVIALSTAENPRGGAWCINDVIAFAPNFLGSLKKVSANGGSTTDLTTVDGAKHTTHRWPSCLPDGKHILYLATNHQGGRPEDNGIYFAGFDGKDARQVIASDAEGIYASGYLLFHSQTALMAQPFDPSTGKLSGEPAAILDKVKFDSGVWRALFSVSDNGRMAYFPGGSAVIGSELALYDRAGKLVKIVGELGSYMDPAISPDGKRLAYLTGDPLWSVWILDIDRGTRTRITFDRIVKTSPSWSADGKMLLYNARSAARTPAIRAKAANGTGAEQTLVDDPDFDAMFPEYSPDGKYIVYTRMKNGRGVEIVAKPLTGQEPPITVVASPGPQATIQGSRISPNGKWVAYQSDETGRVEVYVAPFPKGEGRWQVSNAGGSLPSWRRDSHEIYYLASPQLYAVTITDHAGNLEIGAPQFLFRSNVAAIGALYSPGPDGKTFIVQRGEEESHAPLNFVTNWLSDLNK